MKTIIYGIAMLLGAGQVAAHAETPAIHVQSGGIVDLTSDNFQQVIGSSKVVVVKVYTEWCGSCRRLAPAFTQLSSEYSGRYCFAKVDGDSQSKLANSLKVTSYPTIIFYKEGREVGRSVGFGTKERLVSEMKRSLGEQDS